MKHCEVAVRGYHLTSFGIWLKSSLASRQMTQKDLAKLVGTTETSISRYVHGERMPRLSELNKILDIFRCHIEILPNK